MTKKGEFSFCHSCCEQTTRCSLSLAKGSCSADHLPAHQFVPMEPASEDGDTPRRRSCCEQQSGQCIPVSTATKKALLDSTLILNEPHCTFPNECEVAKTWRETRIYKLLSVTKLIILYSYVWTFSYPSMCKPYLPFKVQLFLCLYMSTSTFLCRIHISIF